MGWEEVEGAGGGERGGNCDWYVKRMQKFRKSTWLLV